MRDWRARVGVGSAVAVVGVFGAAGPGCGSSESYELGTAASAVVSPDIVISQVYGGGGNSGATYKNDFIELFNRGTTAVTVDGWSVQYASATGSTWQATNLAGTIQPGHYYLIKEAAGTGGTQNLPTPDVTGSIAMSATAGKVALVVNQTKLTCGTSCVPSASIRDFVGYGSASSYEGSGSAPALDNTHADLRAGGGCTDTDNNAADFSSAAATPRNSASTSNACTPADGGAGGSSGSGGSSGGGTTLPSPTLPPVTSSSLKFGALGDTRPPSSTSGGYPQSLKNIIGSIFTGLQAQGAPFAVSAGDYCYSASTAGAGVPQLNDYMTARGNFAGKFLPAIGNHECSTATTSNCPVGSYTGLTQDYVNLIVQPSTGQAMPYFSALYSASDGSWTAKFIVIAANAWDSAQSSWLQATLNVPTTYTFAVRHEPSNDTRAPGTTPSESMLASAFSAGALTLSITGHTHLVQLPGGTQPYGDPYGATQAYEMIVGNGGAPLDAGSYYGYAVMTRRASDGAIVTQMYESADSSGNPITPNVADPSFRFAVNPNGSPNANTSLP